MGVLTGEDSRGVGMSEAATDWLTFWQGSAWWLLPLASSFAVGVFLTLRRRRNALGWVFLAFGSIGTLGYLCFQYATAWVALDATQGPGFGVRAALWFAQSTPMLTMSLASVLPLLLFPEGVQTPRWRPVLWLAAANTALMTGLAMLVPTLEMPSSDTAVDNPFAPSWMSLPRPYDSAVAGIAMTVFQVTVVVAGAGLVLRFHRSRGLARVQMRWFAFAGSLVTVAAVLGTRLEDSDFAIVSMALPLTLAFLPVACGVAIMRYRLYEIDRIISRTTAYALVTGVMLGVYAVVVTSLTTLVPGSGDGAVAAAALASAAAFRPVLRWARRIVDRRFNRDGYNAERMLEQYSARLRDRVDGDEVVEDLLSVLDRTLQPGAAGVWLRSPASRVAAFSVPSGRPVDARNGP